MPKPVIGNQLSVHQQVMHLMQSNRLAEAQAMCRAGCKKNKKDPEIWYLQGVIDGQLGDLIAASKSFAKVVKLNPKHAQAWYGLGTAAQKSGDMQGAVNNFKRAVALHGKFVEAHYNLSLALHELGEYEHALIGFNKVKALRPTFVEIEKDLGAVYYSLGQFEQALNCYNAMIAVMKNSMLAYLGRGMVYIKLEQTAEAEQDFKQALGLKGDHVKVYFHFGNLRYKQCRYDEALDYYQQAIQASPTYAEAYYNLALVYIEQANIPKAIETLQATISYDVSYHLAYFKLAYLYAQQGALDDAIINYDKVIALNPKSPEALNNLGNIFQQQGRHAKAVKSFQSAIQHNPLFVDAWVNLGNALLSTNHLDDALDAYEKALEIKPNYTRAIAGRASIFERRGLIEQSYALVEPFIDAGIKEPAMALVFGATARKLGKTEQAVQYLMQVLSSDNLEVADKIDIHFLLGKLYDGNAMYDEAFKHYRLANETYKQKFRNILSNYDSGKDRQQVDRIIQVFSEDYFRTAPRSTNDSQRPIFVVGMPRSGTTLTEQILASHRDVYGAGELVDLYKIKTALPEALAVKQEFPECAEFLSGKVLDKMAHRYLDRLAQFDTNALRVVDKMPHNFMLVGLIAQLFPKSRVIHVARDPIDTCLSIYFQKFNTNHPYACDLESLGKYYGEYQRLMQHWLAVLKFPVFDLSYEKLVREQELVTRQMIDFCELDWDPNCLHFHAIKRDVVTPSYDQVRQPMYQKSAGRWQFYEAHLVRLRAALANSLISI